MINSYKYLISSHIMLNDFVIQFFERIEHETGPFDNAFFGLDFYDIVRRHPKIVKEQLINIYNVLRRLDQTIRTAICNQIKDSNNIELICSGGYLPIILDSNVKGLRKLLRDFFLNLYDQVLDGNAFRDKFHTTLLDHFNEFRRTNKNTTLCPTCGIGELKMAESKTRDQYDHFLPKSLYPFSSVNFENLILCCKECNSFDVKGDKDTVALSTGRLFYPFDFNHKQLSVSFTITTDNANPEDIIWNITYSSPDGKVDEIQSWRNIYDIDTRYSDFVKGRIEKWYRFYWEFVNDAEMAHIPEEDRKLACLKALEKMKSLNFHLLESQF
ncbi:hypothetical protein JJC03_14440 [Flavobacterium oreochromis]|uniref:hypothetical protein n=1 Tax=Flavobacterium oreochromis TaxID=2906078 RepID=UPI001CE4BEAD|nr:hypothetical protein [Flavobacterium oreochromis]QYS86158.1 hypothetical protein JJC03_14440 [Flavobacterium oreochromis]